jgi:heptosyltransferase-2
MAVDPPPLEDAAARGGALMQRIVVRAPNWVGDTVLSLPALRDVRRNFKAARLEVLARPGVADVYRTVAEVDGVRESRSWREDVVALRGAFDLGLLLPNSFGSALALVRAGVEERWGYATDGRGPLLTRRCPIPAEVRGESEVYYYRAMLGGVGLEVSAVPDVSLRPLEPWRERARTLLGEGGPWLGINPGASYGTAKRWHPVRYAAVADRLAKRYGLRPVVVGGPAERPVAEALAAAMDTTALNLCGETSLGDLLGVLSELRLLLTNDSGPMHLAAALGTPLVAVFGSTDWRETAPFSKRAVLVREHVPCAPCKLRECPIDHRCMTRIDVERVAAEAERMLEAA